MLRASAATGARSKIRGMCDSEGVERKAVPTARQVRDDDAVEGPSDVPDPPNKKSRRGRQSTSPAPEGTVKRNTHKKSASKNEKSSSKKLKYDVPRREKTRFIYNTKFKKLNKLGLRSDGASSSKEGAGGMSQEDMDTGVGGSVVENNNEFTEKAGGSGKRRRRQKKRSTKVDQGVVPTKKVRKEKAEKDSGVGSLADLLDGMAVDETRKKPTATVTSKNNVFDPEQVVEYTKMNWDEDRGKSASINSALRSTVVVDGIPFPMLEHIDISIKDFFASCGHIIHYRTHEFLQEDNYTFSATVHFESDEASSKALARNGACFGGVAVRVRSAGPLEWTPGGLAGPTGMVTRRVTGMQPFGLMRPSFGHSLDAGQHFYYPGRARVEGPNYGLRFERANVSSDSD